MDLQERHTNYSKLLNVYHVCVSICITVFIHASVYLHYIDRQTRIRAKKYTEDEMSRVCARTKDHRDAPKKGGGGCHWKDVFDDSRFFLV